MSDDSLLLWHWGLPYSPAEAMPGSPDTWGAFPLGFCWLPQDPTPAFPCLFPPWDLGLSKGEDSMHFFFVFLIPALNKCVTL